MRLIVVGLACLLSFAATALAVARLRPRPRPAAAVESSVSGEPEGRPARAVRPAPQLTLAMSALASAQGAARSKDVVLADLPFVNQLYVTDLKAAISVKNGIRRALRDVLKASGACFAAPPEHDLRLEYRYSVESHGDRVRVSGLSVRDATGAPLPEEAARCFAGLADRTFETTAAAILPGALKERYDPEHFFIEANFTDSEIAVVRAPPAP
jgi:hypothetical protein